ncbi:hypothetical protein, variant 1 [Aphanomyces astaci]|uniref:FHA domain-containing protein n=1 Tax=Aphanomyces astaci TaxID=112090 RepID=W4G387_APHAT|nr:hypothetical protein, variant 1 [Aphanomyces astaci]ETV73741.1 hypothetical protein, variant 1 [Aphanomyces astaci]|eukprot:XP_009836676.1 hypothetical protein, variant 1 [Aphanomyces astaci]
MQVKWTRTATFDSSMTNAGELEQGSKLRRPLGDLDDAGSTPRKTKRLMVVHSNATHATPLKHQTGTATTVSYDIHPRTSLALSTGPAITALTLSSAATIQHTAEITAPSLDPIAPIRGVNNGKKRIQGCIVSCFYLHLDPEAKLPTGVRSRLQKHQLAHFAFGGGKLKSLKLGRDMFGSAVETLNTRRLGRNHCKLTHERGTLYVERCSPGSVVVNGVHLEQHRRVALRCGDKVALLEKPTLSLVYVVSRKFYLLQASRRSIPRHDRTHTIAVCAAAPLVGLDRQGNLHPIPELEVERHLAIIRECTAHRPCVHVKLHVATWPALHSLLSWGCQVLHFLGQGNHEHVYLEDHLGLVHPLTYVDFFGMLEVTSTASKRTLKLVVLSYTPSRKLVNAFVAHGVPHVLVVNNPNCLSAFYTALTGGHSVQQSVNKSLAAVGYVASTAPSLVDATPSDPNPPPLQLYPGGLHDEIIFRRKVGSSDPYKAPMPAGATIGRRSSRELPALPPSAESRPADVFRLCELLATNSRLVTITSTLNDVDTEVAIALAHRVDSRHSILGFGHRIVCGFVSAFMQKRASESGNFCMWTYVRKVTRTHSTTNTTKWPSLIVLIGCDPWLADEHTSAGFRAMLQTWLDATAHLKVVLTATTAVTSTHKLQHIAEDIYPLENHSSDVSDEPTPHLKTSPASDAALVSSSQEVPLLRPADKEELNARFQTLALL